MSEIRLNVRRLILVPGLLTVLLGASSGCGSANDATSAESSQPSPVLTAPASPTVALESIKLPGTPKAADYGFGAVWVSIGEPFDTGGVAGVVKIDDRTKTPRLAVKGPERFAIGSDALWVVVRNPDTGKSVVHKVDPDTGKTVWAARLQAPSFDVDVGPNAIWVTMNGGVGRVNPRTGAVKLLPVGADSLDGAPDYVLATDTDVWVSDNDTGEVNRIDPTTDKVVAKPKVAAAKDMVLFQGAVWVGSDDGHVSRIDVKSNRVTNIPGVGSVKAITACGGAIWAPHRDAGVDRIDPATNQPQMVLPLGNDLPLGIACGNEELWVTGWNDKVVYRHPLS